MSLDATCFRCGAIGGMTRYATGLQLCHKCVEELKPIVDLVFALRIVEAADKVARR